MEKVINTGEADEIKVDRKFIDDASDDNTVINEESSSNVSENITMTDILRTIDKVGDVKNVTKTTILKHKASYPVDRSLSNTLTDMDKLLYIRDHLNEIDRKKLYVFMKTEYKAYKSLRREFRDVYSCKVSNIRSITFGNVTFLCLITNNTGVSIRKNNTNSGDIINDMINSMSYDPEMYYYVAVRTGMYNGDTNIKITGSLDYKGLSFDECKELMDMFK